jgi:hypothetical protein
VHKSAERTARGDGSRKCRNVVRIDDIRDDCRCVVPLTTQLGDLALQVRSISVGDHEATGVAHATGDGHADSSGADDDRLGSIGPVERAHRIHFLSSRSIDR